MRVLEQVMSVWPMADLQKQIDAVREAFSADTRKPFVLKPSFPYGSPHPSSGSSPPQSHSGPAQSSLNRAGALEQQLGADLQHVGYPSHSISPPLSTGTLDLKSDSPNLQSLVMMSAASQAPVMTQNLSLSDAPVWNPSRIFE